MKRIIMLILVLALCANSVAALAAEYEEYNPKTPQINPVTETVAPTARTIPVPVVKPTIVATTTAPAVSYSAKICIAVIGNVEKAVIAFQGALKRRGATIILDRSQADVVVNLTADSSVNYENNYRSNDYGTQWNSIRIKTGKNGYYGNTINLPLVVNHEKNEQKFIAHVNLTAQAVYATPPFPLIGSVEASADADKVYKSGSDNALGVVQSRTESSGGDDREAITAEALRLATEQLADNLVNQLQSATVASSLETPTGVNVFERTFEYKNFPEVGNQVGIYQDGFLVGKARIIGLADTGKRWKATCQLLKGANPASCNWQIEKNRF